jgi:uroporphyrinogen-III synthase
VFTSATGVRAAFARAGVLKSAAWSNARFAAIGPATARALRRSGVDVDFVPDSYVGEALADGLPDVAGRRVLLLRAQDGRDVLRDRLLARGAQVRDVAAYTTRAMPLGVDALAALRAGVDAITFTSPSIVEHVVAALGADAGALLSRAAVVTIGPITSDAVRKRGLDVAAEARVATLDGLVAALAAHFDSNPS